ncbi:hypothetical protein F5880DRAFT_1699377 [Lentinula raphanica]|nr:hypothetical protein F5880DRAFT_1699377 [Lentinula raphanica]
MSTYPSLPNELLESIVAYIAHTPRRPDSRSKSSFKCASPELLALSVANWQLRRVCLPFLFANIKLRDEMEVQKAEKFLALFSKFTKILVIKPLCYTEDRIIAQMLPQFEQLSEVELRRCRRRTDLLRSIIAHHTVTSVLIDDFPDPFTMSNYDLSKVVLNRKKYSGAISPELKNFLDKSPFGLSHIPLWDAKTVGWTFRQPKPCHVDTKTAPEIKATREGGRPSIPPSWHPTAGCRTIRTGSNGMTIIRLELHKPDSELIIQLGSRIFPRLEEILIVMGTIPVSFFWLPVLSSTHPTLKKFWLIGGHREWFFNVESAPPFLSALIQKSQQQKLEDHFFIEEVGLCRNIGQSLQEWNVIGLTLTTIFASTFLLEILTLIASVFPQLESLTLKLNAHEGMYDIGDLCSVIARFSSLRVVYFHKVFDRLNFGHEIVKITPSHRHIDVTDPVGYWRTRAKRGLFLFTSRLAKQVKTLDSIHISDMGYNHDDSDNRIGPWYLTGWLHVLNGNRAIGGRLVDHA